MDEIDLLIEDKSEITADRLETIRTEERESLGAIEAAETKVLRDHSTLGA